MCLTRVLQLLLSLFFCLLLSTYLVSAEPRISLRYGNISPGFAPPALYRFYNQRQFSAPQKRNNAEVVNHILKNFGTLDRLGDVGK
ncbi:hypothetical protein WR25_09926 [Diploscapter pachys]|uniref:Uncharacterized protein n=1 Tax=Diploscapter pachys TaxID=2018661 RepID=A0A2A2J1X6_9BILA|nr:hypothetical protein WR25_09926 [Diploscapter pachys]